jgi:hypothetical protein
MKNFYREEVYQELINRISLLTKDSQRQWGTMTVAQMLAHCTETQLVSNGEKVLKVPFFVKWFFKGMIKKMVYNDKPFPKNTRTAEQYLQTEEKDFEIEKSRLLESINYAKNNAEKQVSHTLFGSYKMRDSGEAFYKHLDHHLSQFGV